MSTTRRPILKQFGKSWGVLILKVLVVLGIIIFLETIAFNHTVRFDLTPARIYSLSDQTIKILNGLDKDIQFTLFYRQGERETHDDFFRKISLHSPHIKYRLIDLDRNPAQARLYGIAAYGQTIAECEGKKEMLLFPTEEKVINTILKLTTERKRKIYFTNGHGESELKKECSSLKEALDAEGWESVRINLAYNEPAPAGASVLIVGGPKTDFFDQELQAISRYIYGGGKVIFMLEPFTKLPRLRRFLEEYQIVLGDDIIVDKENKLMGGDFLTPIIPYFSRSPITDSLKSPALFCTVRSVEIKEGGERAYLTAYLAKSSNGSWSKRGEIEVKRGEFSFQKGVDRRGPIPVAVIVKVAGGNGDQGRDGGAVVCFGDSDFVNNEFIGMMINKDLFLNTVDWLARERDLISIRAKKYEYPFHHMTKAQGRWVFWLSVVLVPGIFLMIGAGTLMYRRWRG